MNASDFMLLMGVMGIAAGCPSEPASESGDGPSTGTEGGSTSGDPDSGSTSADPTASTSAETGTPSTTSGTSVATSQDGSSDESGDAESTGSTGEPGTSEHPGCEAYYATYDACSPRYAGYGDCDSLDVYLPSADCVALFDDYLGCLSEVDCKTLETQEGFPCRDEFELASGGCEDAIGPCAVVTTSGDFDETYCDAELRNCIDEAEYALHCETQSGGTVTCTCQTDGIDVGTYTIDGTAAICGSGPDEVDQMVEACGWPAAVAGALL